MNAIPCFEAPDQIINRLERRLQYKSELSSRLRELNDEELDSLEQYIAIFEHTGLICNPLQRWIDVAERNYDYVNRLGVVGVVRAAARMGRGALVDFISNPQR